MHVFLSLKEVTNSPNYKILSYFNINVTKNMYQSNRKDMTSLDNTICDMKLYLLKKLQ